jgi:HK97 family phage prohead protease
MSIEYRSTAGPDDIDANDSGTIYGLAIPFNRKTTIGDIRAGGFHEDIAPGACKKSMAEADIVALFNHDSSKPLGRTSAGNLKLAATTRGVEPQLKPVDTSYGLDLAKLVKAKVIRGWSFGFEVIKDTWTDDEGRASDMYSGTNRTINEMRLIEVSPVTFPAYDQTEISSRDSILAARDSRGHKPQAKVKRDTGPKPPATEKPYGDVAYADPGYQKDGKKRYPLDTKAHAKAAWAYINQAANRTPYTAAQLSTMEGLIKAACKKYGVVISEENSLFLAMEWRKHSKRFTEFGEKRMSVAPALQCLNCGSDLICPTCQGDSDTKAAQVADDGRSSEEIPETREAGTDGDSGGLDDDTAKRLVEIEAALSEALKLFDGAGVDKLPADVQKAIALVSSCATHSDHVVKHEDLKPSDAISDTESAGRDADKTTEETRDDKELQPEDSTAKTLTDDALRWLMAQQIRREIDLGN